MIKTAVVRSFFVSEKLMPDINTQNKKLDKIRGGGTLLVESNGGNFLMLKNRMFCIDCGKQGKIVPFLQ